MDKKKTVISVMSLPLAAAGALCVLGFGVVNAPVAHAAVIDSCGPTPADVAQITAIQGDGSLSASDEIKAELAVRRTLIGQTILCAEQEAHALRSALASTTVPDDAAVQQLQSQLEGDINQGLGFYDAEDAKLNVVGIAGTKTIAQEILAWRGSTYAPLEENTNNLILWAQNQELFATAATRMAQTERAVSFIESATPNGDLSSALAAAQADFKNAQNENQQASYALVNGFAPDQTLTTLKQSLAALAATYKDFSNIGTLISGILPQ